MVENKFPESVTFSEDLLNPVLAPEGEILSFAWPKESIQRKGHPAAAKALARLACQAESADGASLPRRRRAASLRRPVGLILWQAAMLRAAERVGKQTGLFEKWKLFLPKPKPMSSKRPQDSVQKGQFLDIKRYSNESGMIVAEADKRLIPYDIPIFAKATRSQ